MPGALKPFISPEEIEGIVKRLAEEIRRDYKDKEPVLVGVLKGAFVFLSDLLRAIELPFEVDFIQTSCYGKCDIPSNKVEITRDVTTALKDRHVILVDGIVDRGVTAEVLLHHLAEKGPASIKLCTLLLREDIRGGGEMRPDYVGRTIGQGFVVGYGMDLGEKCRGLKGIYLVGEGKA